MNEPDHQQPAETVVLLGASNLTMGFPLIAENLFRSLDAPLRVFAAMGHGRSYGQTSRVLWRELPGILESGLWDRLASDEPDRERTKLLLTDVGNDLAYGVPVATILEWVEECLRRVSAAPENTILTLPPVESVERMPAWRYTLMRTVLFPGCRISFDTMRQRAAELHERLTKLGERVGAALVRPDADWYGFDPIHPKRSVRPDVWKAILTNWPRFDATAWTDRQGHRFRGLRPAFRKLAGRDQKTPQPALTITDGDLLLF